MSKRAAVDEMCRELGRAAAAARSRATGSDPEQARYLLGCATTWAHLAKHRADDRGNCSMCRSRPAPCSELQRQHGLAQRLDLVLAGPRA
jgi:hypothetical protein